MADRSDADHMGVMAHPVRFDLLDVLRTTNDPVTVTEMRRRMPTLPTTVRRHLDAMASAGLVETTDGGDTWSATGAPVRFAPDPDAGPDRLMLRDIPRVVVNRRGRRSQAWRRAMTDPEWSQWAEASIGIDTTLTLDQAELVVLEQRLMDVVRTYKNELGDSPRTPTAETVHLCIEAFPLRAALAADES